MGQRLLRRKLFQLLKIESIDYNRDSVRSILKGYAPKDDEETRIFGIKKALISLLIKIISLQKKISTSYI